MGMLASTLLFSVQGRCADESAPEIFVERIYGLPDDANPFFEPKSRRALDLYFAT